MNFDEVDPHSVLFENVTKEWGDKMKVEDKYKKFLKQECTF